MKVWLTARRFLATSAHSLLLCMYKWADGYSFGFRTLGNKRNLPNYPSPTGKEDFMYTEFKVNGLKILKERYELIPIKSRVNYLIFQ